MLTYMRTAVARKRRDRRLAHERAVDLAVRRIQLRPAMRLVHSARDAGASAVEYGLLVAAIAAVIVVSVFAMGQLVGSAFETTCTNLEAAPGMPQPSCA